MQAANFIILFAGREGSSAIINMLSAQPGIHVPLWEDLDSHRFNEQARLPEIMDGIFRDGVYPKARFARSRLASRPRQPPPEGTAHIGFKWRPSGDPLALAPVLRRHRVVVFVLCRHDLIEKAASTYLTFEGTRRGDARDFRKHPQFHVAGLPEKEREAYLEAVNGFRTRVRGKRFRRMLRNIAETKARHSRFALALARAGVPVLPLDYAEFCRDRVAFVAGIMAAIGSTAEPVDECGFEKVMRVPAAPRLGGLRAAALMPRAVQARLRYRLALARIARAGRMTPLADGRAGKMTPPDPA